MSGQCVITLFRFTRLRANSSTAPYVPVSISGSVARQNRWSSAAGLPVVRKRRAVGLRREEPADLAGVSVDYVVRLEQGRATTPSASVLVSLARALQLSTAERDHLYRPAGIVPPADGTICDHLPPGMQRMLVRLGDVPVAVFAADWELVWRNHGWAALLGDPLAAPPRMRNFARDRFPVGADH
ncbi:helix-turn-helix domain-containing protein, partial [Nonomuraea maritima]|uniref:helix-turn-helix domain-containing protein n=1 Tax=Nonomuraea maritima TaxID=683260 RepID=UPI003CCC2156